MPGVNRVSWFCIWTLILVVSGIGAGTILVADERNVSRNAEWTLEENDDLDSNTTLNETAADPLSWSSPAPTAVSVSGGVLECPGCAEKKRKQEETLTPAEIRKIRIKMIKEQILTKLNLKSKPHVHASRPKLPDIIFKREVLGAQDLNSKTASKDSEDYETTKKVVLFPTNSTTNYSCSSDRSNASRCFTFQISSRNFAGGVMSAELFLYKNTDHPHSQSLVITEIIDTGHNRTKKERIVRVEEEPTKSGWLRFELKQTLQRWVTKPHLSHSFQITCKGKGCHGSVVPVSTDNKFKPFIVISTGPVLTVSRKRRETVCTEKSTRCCKESLTITFDEIGWGDWVIHPANFTANYCRGTCDAELGSSRYLHTTVMQKYILSQKGSMSLCCSPSRLSSMSIIYMGDDDTVLQKEMPNMIVQACDCS